nr:hypothetical protein CFP56_12932 [Quercus suber]
MSFSHSIVVTAGGGHIGSQLVSALVQENIKVVLPTSNASRLQSTLADLATKDNVAVEEGSVSNPLWLESLFHKHVVDTVLLNLTGTDELMTTLNFFDAMKRAGTIKHVVYISACGDFVSRAGFQHVLRTHSAMHVLVKPLIEYKLIYSDFPWTTTVLGPTLFYDNDLRSKNAILKGLFDEPLTEKGLSRVSTVDIANIAHKALVEPTKWAGQKIMIGSKRRYTGTEIAKLWGEAIGREVKMRPANEDGFTDFESSSFEQEQDRAWTRDKKLMYEAFELDGFGMTDEDYAKQCDCLGREPQDYEEWVRKTGKAWIS